jgi:hypothetical protein
MSEDLDQPDYATRAVRPIECLRGGWALVKDDYWLLFGISFVGMLIAQFGPMGILLGPMMCGIYLCLLRKDRGRRFKFETLFKGFNYFLPGLVAALFTFLPVFLVVIPLTIVMFVDLIPMAGAGQPGPDFLLRYFEWMGILIGVSVVLSLITSTLFFFAYPLIVARDMGGVQAIRTSMRAAMGNLGGVFGLVVLTMLLEFAGALACGIGGLFVLPIHLAANIVAFRQVFGDEDDADEVVED